MALPKPIKLDNNKFLKLSDGQSAMGVFVPEKEIRHSFIEWVEGKKQDRSREEWESNPTKVKLRYTMHFIQKDGDELMPKEFEMAPSVYERVCEIESMGHDLLTTWCLVSRKGEKVNTRWSVDAAPNGSLTEKERKTVDLIVKDLGVELPPMRPDGHEDDVP